MGGWCFDNISLADSAEDFHESLYINNVHVTNLIDTYYIAGYGRQTIDKVEFDMMDWDVYSYTYSGDSLVADWSATLGDKYSARTFYAQNVSHMGLISDLNVTSFIIQLIEGNASTDSFNNIFIDKS